MSAYQGDFTAGASVRLDFSTNAQTGARVAFSDALEAGDIRVYRDGSSTERSSTSGFTVTSAFDSLVGVHMAVIDTSDNTDAGFFAAGHDYNVLLYPDTETVDGLAPAAWIGSFSIQNRFSTAAAAGTEPSAVPAHTATFVQKIAWLFAEAVNKKTQTATTQLLRNSSDAGTIGTKTLSDDLTTFISGATS